MEILSGNGRLPTGARLALEDGGVWRGDAFGAPGTRLGEVVFNTGLTGYQEVISDPSYAGQIVVMTAAHIGNTGINLEDDESRQAFLNGLIVREYSACVSNWRATDTLEHWLKNQDIIGITDVDTRALTRRIRNQGSLKGIISTDQTLSDDELVEQARRWPGLESVDLVQTVTCETPYEWETPTTSTWEFSQWQNGLAEGNGALSVVVYDFGLKRNILRRLTAHGCRVIVVPANTPASEALKHEPDGVLLSNGPGDPAAVPYAMTATRELLGQVPIFGICLGHQILARTLGAKTYKMKFGHHGGNQPVRHLPTGQVEISAHNHNFAVDPKTLPPEVEVTHINLNDGCCEGLKHGKLRAFGIQYHPEAAPGPHDSDAHFLEFLALLKAAKSRTKSKPQR